MIGFTGNKITVIGLLAGYVDDVAELEVKAMKDLVKAIEKDGVITLDDRANVEALVAANKAYVALYVDDLAKLESSSSLAAATKAAPTFTSTALSGTKGASDYENAIFELDVKAAAKLVRELPVDANAKKVAEVKAAVDALGFDGICKMLDTDIVPDSETILTKLNKLEQDSTSDDIAKAYVQDLKIKARSVKTSKGVKVTVNANVQELIDNGYTVSYKFYRSTKSNKNFGTAKITKTENTYLNTSGTKGTKYYYKAKLVVKNAAGEVVATTPLTQCLYACRTF